MLTGSLGAGLFGPGSVLFTSLPMLAPILIAAGLLMKGISTNAGYLLPRVAISAVVVWMATGSNNLTQGVITHMCDIEVRCAGQRSCAQAPAGGKSTHGFPAALEQVAYLTALGWKLRVDSGRKRGAERRGTRRSGACARCWSPRRRWRM
jgi:hypothetical protein